MYQLLSINHLLQMRKLMTCPRSQSCPHTFYKAAVKKNENEIIVCTL